MLHNLSNTFIAGFEKRAVSMRSLLGPTATKGFIDNARRTGMNSITLWPTEFAAKKLLGKKKAFSLFSDINEAILDVDTVLGHHAHQVAKKLPLVKKLFLTTEKLQHGGLHRHFDRYTGKGVKLYHDAHRPSIVAPLDKASRIVAPIVTLLAVDNYLKKKKDAKQRNELVQTSGQ